MKYDTKIREEELKRRVADDWFAAYETTRIIGNIDFAVDMPATELNLGYASDLIDIPEMLTKLQM